MRICNYELGNRYDKFGRIESNQIILARPGKRTLGVLNGVREDSCSLDINLNNTWTLDFDVDRVVDGSISNYYDRITQKMELHLPGYGWFKITDEPVMSNDGNTEILSVHAESLEIEFQQYVIKGFECNTGTTSSLEYLAADNIFYYDNDKSYPFFRENVRFYRDTTAWEAMMDAFEQTDKSEQALLNLIPQHPCIMDCWRINYDLSDFDNAIDQVVANGSGRDLKVLKSYSGQFAKFEMEGLKQQAQQTAFSLTRVWPELLDYITATDIDYKCYDETHDGDYTLDEIINLELQRQKDLSLLDVISNHYGWRVGFVDDSVIVDSDVDDDRIPLSQKTGMFEVDSENAYTFMTQEMASYFRCVFVFDTYEKTVNAYNINNLGVDTNIFLSFHNIQNSVERSGNDTIHTAFYIQGGDDLDPLEANFGENEIWDLSYYMNTDNFSQETIDKYNAWLEYRESQRSDYMDLSVQFRKQLEVVNELYDRVPIDAADTTQYGTMSDEELEEEKAKYEALVRGIESTYVDQNNEFDIDILQEMDPLVYQEYIIATGSILSDPRNIFDYLEYDAENDEYIYVNGAEDTSEYRMGNIDIYIFNRGLANGRFIEPGDTTDIIKAKSNYKKQKEYLDNYIYDFDTYGDAYGVAELENRLQDLENKYTTLWNKGYGVEPTQEEREADPYRASQYDLYVKYKEAYAECESVLEQRRQEYDDASDNLNDISSQMMDIKTDVAIENEQFGFTDEELELIKKYLYYTDYTNENMIITSISTPEEIVETEYQLIKDAEEELYAAAHPQWVWSTSQDNLFLIAENDDWYGSIPHPTFSDWRRDLMIGNFIHVGFREDDHLPDCVYVDRSENQVKLRLITIGLNPFMIEPTIDLTFSSMIQYKSRRNDFVDLLGLASGVGDHQITATFQSKKLDSTFEIDSSFVMKLLNNGAFANYAAGSILGGSTVSGSVLDALIVPTIHAAEINVGQITGDIASFMETYTQYLDADTIVARILSANTANFNNLSTNILSANNAQIFNSQLANSTVDAQWVQSQIAAHITVADLQAGNIIVSDDLKILSENGLLEMDGQHLIISIEDENENLIDGIQLGYGDSSMPFLKFNAADSNGNPFTGIQLGYASNGLPNLIIRDENGNDGIVIGLNSIGTGNDAVIKPSITIYDDDGTALFTSRGVDANNTVTGVQAAAIANGLIVNDMVHTQTLSKDKMNFNVMEVGDDIIIEQMTYTDGTKFGNEYTTFEQDITNAVAEVVNVVPSVELTGNQTFTVDEDSNILPSRIVIYANPHNGFIPYAWTIDGVDASQYVSSDGFSISVPNTAMTNTTSAVVRCQNNDNSAYDTISIFKLPTYNSAITTIALDNDLIQFATSAAGVPLFRQTATVKVKIYKGTQPFYNFSIDNIVAPSGITATGSSDSIQIEVSPTAAISATSTITFDVVMNSGSTSISKTITVNRLISTASETTVVEYTLQTSNLECDDDAVWTETRPTASAGQFLWYRYRTDYDNGDPSKYSNPHYISTIAGLINMTDAVSKSITNKIWQDDFETYDTQVIRHRESEITQTVDEISMRVSETSSDLSTLTSTYTQTVGEINMTISNLSDDLGALSDTQGQTASDLLDLIGDYQNTVADFNNLHSSYQDTVAALDNLSSDYSDTATQFLALRTEYDQTIDGINTTITGITTDFDALSSSVTQSVGEISSTVTSISGDLLVLSGEYQGTVSDLSTLLQNYAGTVQALTALSNDYNQTVDDFGVLSTTVTQGFGEINQTVSALSGDLASLNGSYQQTAQALATLNNSFTSLSNNYNQTVQDFAILSSSITERFDSINLTVAGLSSDISSLEEGFDETVRSLTNTVNNNYLQFLDSIQDLRDDTDTEFLAVRSDFQVGLGQISSTVTGITTDLNVLSTNYTQTAQDFSWLFVRSDPTDPTSGMVLTSDGLNLINSSITISNNYNFIAEGALQIRSVDGGNINTDENDPLENDQSETLDAVGYTTLHFDNGYPNDDPNRNTKPWVSFLGHLVDVNPFDIELSDSIINSTTQFVVYNIDNDADYQYVVWYDVDHRAWKAINVNFQSETDNWTPVNYMQVVSWEWNNDTDMVVAEFTKESDGDVYYQSYYPAKTYQGIQQVAMLQMWGIDGALTETTTINGGSIQTDTIDSLAIKTSAIRSRQYSETPIPHSVTLPDEYVLTPIGNQDIIFLQQVNSTDYIITPEEDGDVTIRVSYDGNCNGFTFYYSIDYLEGDLSIGGGFTPSGDDITEDIILDDPQTSGTWTFNSSTDDIVFYITLPSAEQGVQYHLTTYLSNGAQQRYFTDSSGSIICNGYDVGETYQIYYDTVDNNIIKFMYNDDAVGKTLKLVATDINPSDITRCRLIYYDEIEEGVLHTLYINLTSSSQDYLLIDYEIPDVVSQFGVSPQDFEVDYIELDLRINNLSSSTDYIIQSYIEDVYHEHWDSVTYQNEQLENNTDTYYTSPIYSDSGTWFNLEDSGFIRSKNFAIDADGNAYFSGTVYATSGEIGGWSIDNDLLYYSDTSPTSSSMIFSPTGLASSNPVGGSSGQQSWMLTARDKFGITTNGDVYALGNFSLGGNNGLKYNATTGKVTLGSDCQISWSSVDGAGDFITSSEASSISTQITNTTITTGNLTAQNLKVKAANITGQLTASQINTSGLIAENISATTISGKTITGSTINTNNGGTITSAAGSYSTTLAAGYLETNYLIVTGGGQIFPSGGYMAFGGNIICTGSATFQGEAICEQAKTPKHQTVSPNCYITEGGAIHKTAGTSSKRYKDISRHLTSDDINRLYDIGVYWFKYKKSYINRDDERYDLELPGFIAEELDEIMPITVDHLEDGRAEKWNSQFVVPLMFQMIKNEHERNDKLQTEVSELKDEINELKTMIKQLTER